MRHDRAARLPEHEQIRQVRYGGVELPQHRVLGGVKQDAQNSDQEEKVVVRFGSGVKGVQRNGREQAGRGGQQHFIARPVAERKPQVPQGVSSSKSLFCQKASGPCHVALGATRVLSAGVQTRMGSAAERIAYTAGVASDSMVGFFEWV